jgi:hypothetical protein
MKAPSVLIAMALIAAAATPSLAQSANHAAAGVPYPNTPRYLPNGEVEPPPAARANGGVGEDEVPFDNAQTRSGGPVGGNAYQNR